MEMTIDEAIETIAEIDKAYRTFSNNEYQALNIAIDTMRKYQMLQTQYVERLRADMAAMITELQLDIEELKSYESADGQDLVMLADIGIMLQEKINALKGANNE